MTCEEIKLFWPNFYSDQFGTPDVFPGMIFASHELITGINSFVE